MSVELSRFLLQEIETRQLSKRRFAEDVLGMPHNTLLRYVNNPDLVPSGEFLATLARKLPADIRLIASLAFPDLVIDHDEAEAQVIIYRYRKLPQEAKKIIQAALRGFQDGETN